MGSRSLVDRLLSPAGFGLALLLFLLPFVTVSCGSSTEPSPFTVDYTFTGLDLVIGGPPGIGGTIPDDNGAPITVDGASDDSGFTDQVGRPVQPLAVVAALAILGGMIGCFALPVALRGRVTGALALAAAVLLVVEVLAVVPGRAAEELAKALPEVGLATHATPAPGFYLAVAVLIGLVVREVITARRPAATITTAAPTDATGPPIHET